MADSEEEEEEGEELGAAGAYQKELEVVKAAETAAAVAV